MDALLVDGEVTRQLADAQFALLLLQMRKELHLALRRRQLRHLQRPNRFPSNTTEGPSNGRPWGSSWPCPWPIFRIEPTRKKKTKGQTFGGPVGWRVGAPACARRWAGRPAFGSARAAVGRSARWPRQPAQSWRIKKPLNPKKIKNLPAPVKLGFDDTKPEKNRRESS